MERAVEIELPNSDVKLENTTRYLKTKHNNTGTTNVILSLSKMSDALNEINKEHTNKHWYALNDLSILVECMIRDLCAIKH